MMPVPDMTVRHFLIAFHMRVACEVFLMVKLLVGNLKPTEYLSL